MHLNALGYVGIRTKNLEDWAAYGTNLLGMQLVDKSRGTLALRMDDRKQRVIIHTDEDEGPSFYGWEVADAAALDALAVGSDIAIVLRVARAHAADRADAHAVEVRAGFGGVSLEIAVQRAICLRNSQFIAGTREMIHADVEIARAEKSFEPGAEDAKLFHSFRQVLRERTLLFFQPRHMSVAEHGDTIRRERQSLINRVLETLRCLVGQAVDQVHIQAFETEFTRGDD